MKIKCRTCLGTRQIQTGRAVRPCPNCGMADARKVATSHGVYSYWLNIRDLYVYQRNDITGDWIGWLCTLPVWESVFSKSPQFAEVRP
jgi:hypothetical protein